MLKKEIDPFMDPSRIVLCFYRMWRLYLLLYRKRVLCMRFRLCKYDVKHSEKLAFVLHSIRLENEKIFMKGDQKLF
jgi:hypothetical protein